MAYLRDGQTCRHCIQGNTGIASTLFKEEAEQRQCPTPLPTDLQEAEQYSCKAGSTPKSVERNVFERNLCSTMFQQWQICIFPCCKLCLPGRKALKLLRRLSQAIRHCFLYPELMENFISPMEGKDNWPAIGHSPFFPLARWVVGYFAEIASGREGRDGGEDLMSICASG